MGFSRQEYWGGLPFSSPGDLPNPGIKLKFPVLASGFFTTELPEKPTITEAGLKHCLLFKAFPDHELPHPHLKHSHSGSHHLPQIRVPVAPWGQSYLLFSIISLWFIVQISGAKNIHALNEYLRYGRANDWVTQMGECHSLFRQVIPSLVIIFPYITTLNTNCWNQTFLILQPTWNSGFANSGKKLQCNNMIFICRLSFPPISSL